MESIVVVKRIGDDELYHHGIKGMKWGIRRYQNKDGSLTEAGRRKAQKHMNRLSKKHDYYSKAQKKADDLYEKYDKETKKPQTPKTKGKISYLMYEISNAETTARVYRDRSKRQINKISKIDEKLGNDLKKKYSSMLDKTYLHEFTLSELRSIQKDPSKMSDKAQKFVQHEMKRKMSDVAMQHAIFNQQQQMQIQQQINMQIQQQINMQIQQQMNMHMMGMM